MKKSRLIPIVMILMLAEIGATENVPKARTTLSFQPGILLYEDHSEAYAVFGYDTSFGPLFVWTGFGGTIKVDGANDSAASFLYPWLSSTFGVNFLANESGDSFARAQVKIPWSSLSYQFLGGGVKAQVTLPLDAANRGKAGFVFQGECMFFPGVFNNPWYDVAKSDGLEVGQKYWQLAYGGIIKYYDRDWHLDFEARFITDNHAYLVEGRRSTITNTDWLLTLGVQGIALCGGISTNGWNYTRNGGGLVPKLLPNLSLILYP